MHQDLPLLFFFFLDTIFGGGYFSSLLKHGVAATLLFSPGRTFIGATLELLGVYWAKM
jgi:hypothetical protein